MMCLAIMLNFSQSLYIVDEDAGVARPELILSNPSSTDFTVYIITNNITASSKKYMLSPYKDKIILCMCRRERL